jgi:amino acid adenylation domain-containing protein
VTEHAPLPDLCIHELFHQQAARNPEKTAVICHDQKMTYRDLNNAADILACHLREAGVGPEELVGVCASRSIEMVVGPLAVLKAGGVYLPLDPAWPAKRLSLVLEDSGLKHALVQPSHAGNFVGSGLDIVPLAWERSTKRISGDEQRLCDKRALAYVLYTSGSTGQPNGVMVEHRSVVRLVRQTNYHHFEPDEIFLSLSPLTFDASVFELWGPLLNGGTVVIHPASLITPEALGRTIRRNGVTTALLTPALFHEAVESNLQVLSPLRHLFVGGDVIAPRLFRRAVEELNHTRVVAAYGPTENTCITTTYSPSSADHFNHPSVPLGSPVSGTRVQILTEQMTPASTGEIGELCISGDGLARGYLNRPELNATRFVAHPLNRGAATCIYKTGDLARHFPDGTIEFCGRLDHQVKVRGFRIDLLEIESTLKAHSTVRDAVVIACPQSSGSKSLSAFVVPARPAGFEKKILIDYLREQLPSYMLPLDFETLPSLPKNFHGKVDRAALMEIAASKTNLLT